MAIKLRQSTRILIYNIYYNRT